MDIVAFRLSIDGHIKQVISLSNNSFFKTSSFTLENGITEYYIAEDRAIIRAFLEQSDELDSVLERKFMKVDHEGFSIQTRDCFFRVSESGHLNGFACIWMKDIRRLPDQEQINQPEDPDFDFPLFTQETRGLPDTAWCWRPGYFSMFVTERWRALFSIPTEASVTISRWLSHVDSQDLSMVLLRLCQLAMGEIEDVRFEYRVHSHNSFRWMSTKIQMEGPSYSRVAIGNHQEASEYEDYIEQLRFQTTRDALTGLANREFFLDTLKKRIEMARKTQKYDFAVAFIDLLAFRRVNNGLGNQTGDDVLRVIGKRLERFHMSGGCVARLGGDEFVILLITSSSHDSAYDHCHNIQTTISEPILIRDRNIGIDSAIGLRLGDFECTAAHDYLRDSHLAMSQAKKNGSGIVIFNKEMQSMAARSLELEGELRHAMKHGQLSLHYQPIFSLDSNRIVCFEALTRWYHREWGTVGPDSFIAAAEQSGLIDELGEWVLHTSARDMSNISTGHQDLRIAINVSGKQFRRRDFLDRLKEIIIQTKINPELLEFEITETVAMVDVDQSVQVMKGLCDLGVQLALDDFGIGHSSLSCLKRFPVSTLKIDRSFTRDIVTNRENSAIVQAIAALGNSMGLDVRAEGVESRKQLEVLKSFGCHSVQGYYLGRPMPVITLSELTPNSSNRVPYRESISRLSRFKSHNEHWNGFLGLQSRVNRPGVLSNFWERRRAGKDKLAFSKILMQSIFDSVSQGAGVGSLPTLLEILANKLSTGPATLDPNIQNLIADHANHCSTWLQRAGSLIDLFGTDFDLEAATCSEIGKEISEAVYRVEDFRKIKNQIIQIGKVESSQSVFYNRIALGYVLREILTNAMKYSPPETKIDIGCSSSDGNFFIYCFSDAMDRELLLGPQIYEPFVRLNLGFDERYREEEIGLGLGLTLAKSFLLQMFGDLDLSHVMDHSSAGPHPRILALIALSWARLPGLRNA